MGKMQQLLHKLQPPGLGFILRAGKPKAARFTVFDLNSQGFAIAEVGLVNGALRIITCQFVHNANVKIRGELIKEFLDRRNVSTSVCQLVMSQTNYKFLLAEAPKAPLDNLRALMPTKIRDSIPWELNDITSDVLELPDDAYRGRKKSVYVAVAKTATLSSQIDLLHGVGVQPDSVTTLEVAMRGYWSLLKLEANASVAIMRLTETGGVLVVMCDGLLYLARRVAVSLDALQQEDCDRQEIFDQIVLEIQRSVDFYESQLGKGSITKLIVLPPPIDLGIGLDYIDQNINTAMELFDPYSVLGFTQELTLRDQCYCSAALGAALGGLLDA